MAAGLPLGRQWELVPDSSPRLRVSFRACLLALRMLVTQYVPRRIAIVKAAIGGFTLQDS